MCETLFQLSFCGAPFCGAAGGGGGISAAPGAWIGIATACGAPWFTTIGAFGVTTTSVSAWVVVVSAYEAPVVASSGTRNIAAVTAGLIMSVPRAPGMPGRTTTWKSQR